MIAGPHALVPPAAREVRPAPGAALAAVLGLQLRRAAAGARLRRLAPPRGALRVRRRRRRDGVGGGGAQPRRPAGRGPRGDIYIYIYT